MGMYDPKPPLPPKEIPPEGLWGARLYSIVDLGTHDDTFEGVTSQKRKLYIGFELECKMSEGENAGKPFVCGKEYTITNGKYLDSNGNFKPYISKNSNLKKLLKSWLKWTDEQCVISNLRNLIGQPASIKIEHYTLDGKQKYSIGAILSAKNAPPPVNDPILFGLDEPENGYDKLYKWMQDKLAKSYEMTKRPIPPKPSFGAATENGGSSAFSGGHEDDIPFQE